MPGSSTHDPSTTSDSSLPSNKPQKKRKQKLTGSDSPGSKKKDKNVKDNGGVVAAVTRHGAKFTDGNVGKDVPLPPESPPPQSPELEPARPATIPTNGNQAVSPLLDAVSATSISGSTAPSTNDWTRAMGPSSGSPSNLISIMGDSPPTQPSSYEDARGLSYAWSAQQQQRRHYVNSNPYSASPPSNGRRPLSFQMDHYAAGDFRSQASSPPGARRSSMHSPFLPPRATANPPLPHQPQAHFYGAPEIDLDMHPKTGLKAGEKGFYFGFDTLPRSTSTQVAGNDHVVLAGYEGGMDVYSVGKRGVEFLASLKGLRGGVYNAKILPWSGTPDPFGIFPLVAVVIHGPVPPPNAPDIALGSAFDNSSSPRLEGINTPQSESNQRQANKGITTIEAYQTSVEVYSLATNQLIDVLLEAPKIPIKASVTSPMFGSPPPTGAFQVQAEDGYIVAASGTTGECWVYRQARDEKDPGYRFTCVGKLWTSLQQSFRSGSTPEDEGIPGPLPTRKRSQTPILAVNGRWLAYCPPPPSSQVALKAFIPVSPEGKVPGLSSVTSPVLPNESSEVDLPISDGVMNRIMRETTQEVIQGARWVSKQGKQWWNNYWNPGQQPPARQLAVGSPPWGSAYPGRPEAAQFPPTYGVSGQAVTKEPGLVSIVDMHSLMSFTNIHPTTTFKPPLGCSFLSFPPTGLSLFTASNKGDVQTAWDAMRSQFTKSSPLQHSQPHNGHATRVRQVAQFSRMTVARIVDLAWAGPNGERAAMVTERGTVHMLEMPPSAFTWPPPRRRAAAPEAAQGASENASSAVSIASNVLSSAYGATRPLLNSHRRSTSNSQTTSSLMDHASYGGKVLAAGISQSLGNAGTAINHLRHTGENRVSLPLRNMSVGPSCATWITGRKHHTLFVVGVGQVRMFPRKSRRPGVRKDRSRTARVSKYHDFKLRDLPDDLIAPSIKQIIDPIEEFELSIPDHDGSNTLILHPRPRLDDVDHSSEAAIPQAEIESNAPYQPFHTDRRVSLHYYTATSNDDGLSSVLLQMDAVTLNETQKRAKHRHRELAASRAWAFGETIGTVKLDLGLPPTIDEEVSNSIDDHRALPVSAMERVLQVGGNDEQIVVTTRRRRGGNRAADMDEDGFFEDDCEVLDFADQRV
ncbi:hypothetical protein F5B22DRAFT_583517 [Xylaria bambusicola]|uniref:uncharacterized protein n=1 Tax=Xylaria bambusicola TaxID=326684 RepID=UPI002008B790|nr:uncharacterized protein F5B22DRAFT_583517 [Xylaria bambusicola]KAI0528078.1 hypothetical protein F5B22DRAFT_583517 [Xylaria bambusicola]